MHALYSITPAHLRHTRTAAAVLAAWPLAGTPEQIEARHLLHLTELMGQPLGAGQLIDLGVAYHDAMLRITTGTGTDEHASTLGCCSNVAMVLAERGWGDESNLDTIREAQAHLVTLRRRGATTGRYVLTGPGITALNDMLTLHDQQLAADDLSQADLAEALREVHRRLDAGHVLTAVTA